LKAASYTFAQKGFEGARIDAIAKEAGVNKALIYYYFKSKRELLDRLISSFLDESRNLVMKLIREFGLSESENMDQLFDKIFRFLEENEALIRMIMLESFKRESRESFLFDFVDLYLGKDSHSFAMMAREAGLETDESVDMGQIRVTEFFTLLGPVLLYILMRDNWVEYFKVDRELLSKQFIAALKLTHLSHHRESL